MFSPEMRPRFSRGRGLIGEPEYTIVALWISASRGKLGP